MAYNNRGLVYFNLGDYDLAIADYEYALKLDPKYSTATNNLRITNTEKEKGLPSKINFNALTGDNVATIINGSIFEVFNNLGQYNTDLKKKVFLSSDASKKYRQKLDEVKKRIASNNIQLDITDRVELSDYDIEQHGFWLTFGRNYQTDGWFKYGIGYKNSINGYLYEKLPVKIDSLEVSGANLETYKIFLPMDEAKAVNIEGNRNIKIILDMKINNTVEKSFTRYNCSINTYSMKIVISNTYTVKKTYPNLDSLKICINNGANEAYREYQF
jgi:tetratricopeptide (TPR) repeat protein